MEFHNEMRSDLARGDFDGYESGTNIYTMVVFILTYIFSAGNRNY